MDHEDPGATPTADDGPAADEPDDVVESVTPGDFLRMLADVWSKIPRDSLAPDPSARPGPTAAREDVGAAEAATGIGRFATLRELGQGGGGVVVLAMDQFLRREVAVKVPGFEALGSTAARDRFLAEAQAVAALRHPNIVTVLEAAEIGAIPYIVMEFCRAGSLARWLADRPADRPTSLDWSARLVASVADGVQHAHDEGFLHRDLKPSNILLQPPKAPPKAGDDPEFLPKVADFGLAKHLRGDASGRDRTVQGLPLGTIPYMAPEAARGDGRAIGPATDVYGIGVILFELLTRRRPFEGPSQADTLVQVLNEPAPSPAGFRPGLPVDLATICAKCLAREPVDRYASPGEVAAELRRFLGRQPILARPAPAWRKATALARRNPVRSSIVAIAVASAVAAVVAFGRFREVVRRGEVDAVLREVESVGLASLPELAPKLDPTDPYVALRLGRLFVDGTPTQKSAAAILLARARGDCRDHAYAGLLRADPREVGPVARLLRDRLDGLADRLAADAAVPDRPGVLPAGFKAEEEAEARDRLRVNAALALILIGRADRAWPSLRFTPDPQVRSFLIHQMGEAGVAPALIADRLNSEPNPSIRLALIQALGEMPGAAWTDRLRDRLLDFYEHDPHPGVHGSAKWLLKRRGLGERLEAVDLRLAAAPAPPVRRWRVGPLGLTFVRIDDPATGRVIEVADTETTVEQFRRFRPDHAVEESLFPEPDCPAGNMSFKLGALFCNWLTETTGLGPEAIIYRFAPMQHFVPDVGHLDRAGYRLLTDREFEMVGRGEVATRRYHGTTAAMLKYYANFAGVFPGRNGRTYPAATFKPNEFGLFDTLGNVSEVCLSTRAGLTPQNQAATSGSSLFNPGHDLRFGVGESPPRSKVPGSATASPRGLATASPLVWVGLRVARTIQPATSPLAAAGANR